MKQNILTLVCLLLIGNIAPAFAITSDADPCEEYQQNVTMSVDVFGSYMYYYVSYNGIRPHVDSVWIENENDSIVLTSHAQSGDMIDISALGDGTYSFYAQIGTCVVTKSMFITCADYRHITMTVSTHQMDSTIRYDISQKGTITPPYVDSVWITTRAKDSVVFAGHAQSGESIDISFLTGVEYICWIQMGECIISRSFAVRWNPWSPTPDPCEAYSNVTIAVTVAEDYSTIRYDLADDGMPTTIAVDSIWITNNAVSPLVLTGHAQPGEPIDISFLRKGLYVLWVQIEDCVKEGPQFRIDRISTDLDSPADSETAVKILHNGQLLILRNNKVYTLQGVETRL